MTGAIRRAAAILALAAAPFAGCAPAERTDGAGPPGAGTPADEVANDAAPLEEAGTLFDLAFTLTDQDGHEARLADLRGHPFIASMIYTSCTSVCPRVTADLERLERALTDDERRRLRFVLFSLDPERDRPEVLRRFAVQHALDPSRWTLFTTSPDDMRTLANVLGVRFRPDEGGEIAHSAVVAVVDRDGVVRHRQIGIRDDSTALQAALRRVL